MVVSLCANAEFNFILKDIDWSVHLAHLGGVISEVQNRHSKCCAKFLKTPIPKYLIYEQRLKSLVGFA